MCKIAPVFFFGLLLNGAVAIAQFSARPLRDSLPKAFSVKVLPQNFYIQQLSFFCKKELQLQRLTTLPLFIRAGSKDYVDFLEKKPNAAWQRW